MSINQDSEHQYTTMSANSDRLKDIDALYRSQIKQIANEGKDLGKDRGKLTETAKDRNRDISPSSIYSSVIKRVSSNSNLKDEAYREFNQQRKSKIGKVYQAEGQTINPILKLQQNSRASVYLQSQSTRKIQFLQKENQNKQLKLRDLSNKCQHLLQTLKSHLPEQQFNNEIQNLKHYSDSKMERLESLFKIKNQQIFFKMKLQIIGLLQEFQIPKQQINGINQVANQSQLYSFMVRKLKIKLKDFRSKEQQSNFQIQKDRILNQKYEQRIHYLMETNELLKLSESKLKNRVEDLRGQVNQFLQKFKTKQGQIEERESQIFRLKRQNEQLQANNQKLSHLQRNISSERTDEKKIYQAKEKEMKGLLSMYFLERKKLQGALQEKEGQLEQTLIRQKFLQQQNERIQRQYVRWKERYEWLQKEKQNRHRQYEQQKAQLHAQFIQYKNENNQGVYLQCKSQTDDALRKVQQYQTAYQCLINELQQQRRIREMRQQQGQIAYEQAQKKWLGKIKRIQKMKQQQMLQQAADHENRQKQIRQQNQKRQQLIAEEIQTRMRVILAQNQKKATENLINIENQKQQLEKQLQSLRRNLEIKQSMIYAMKSGSQSQQSSQKRI